MGLLTEIMTNTSKVRFASKAYVAFEGFDRDAWSVHKLFERESDEETDKAAKCVLMVNVSFGGACATIQFQIGEASLETLACL